MRKGLFSNRALGRPQTALRFLGAMLALIAVSFLSIFGAVTAHAEGADDWGAAAFAKSAKAAALGSSTSGNRARRGSSTKLASLGGGAPSQRSAPVTGGGVRWVASSGCLNGTLQSVVSSIASSYGAVTVSSTCRSAGRNRAVGGAPKSHHLTGNAVDFRVHGNWGGAYAALRSNGSLGGVKHYGGGLFHIDTGPRRSW